MPKMGILDYTGQRQLCGAHKGARLLLSRVDGQLVFSQGPLCPCGVCDSGLRQALWPDPVY